MNAAKTPAAVAAMIENLDALRAELIDANRSWERSSKIAVTIHDSWSMELEHALRRFETELGQRLTWLKEIGNPDDDGDSEYWIEQVENTIDLFRIAWGSRERFSEVVVDDAR